MQERHMILQENVTPSALSGAASSALPTVEPGFVVSGGLSSRACRFPSCMRVLLPTLASVAAIAFFVLFCFRAYHRRAVQGLRSRRLASSEDDNRSVESCGTPDDAEGQEDNNGSHTSNLPADEDLSLPVKKRKLLRMVETGAGGDGRYPQQQEQRDDRTAAGPSGISSFAASHTPGRLGSSFSSVPKPASPPQTRTPAELDAATVLLNLHPHLHAAGHSASDSKQEAPVDVQQLWQTRQMQWPLQREQQGPQLQEQVKRRRRNPKQRRAKQQQHQAEGLHQQRWQQLHLHHVLWQQQQQVTQQEERGQQQKQAGREQQEDLQLSEGGQQQLLQPAGLLSEGLLEDEWIVPDPPRSEAPQTGAFQQTLQASAPLASARLLMPNQVIVRVIPGYSIVPVGGIPAASAAGPSGDKTAAAPGAAAAAESKAATPGWHTSGPPPSASTTPGEGTSLEMPIVSGSPLFGSTEGAGAASARTAPATTTGPALDSPVSTTPAITESRGTQTSPVSNAKVHPFLHVPKRIVRITPASYLVDMRRAVTTRPGRRDLVSLLQKAHDLLSLEFLYFNDMKQLAVVTEGLVEHAVNHQRRDLSHERIGRAAERLGMRFLLMDTVVCAFIALGQKVEAKYWNLFSRAVSHTPPIGNIEGSKARSPAPSFSLCQDLSRAILTLKEGKRPKPEELLKIKRRLLCSRTSPARFQKPDFDRWREDDFRRTGGP